MQTHTHIYAGPFKRLNRINEYELYLIYARTLSTNQIQKHQFDVIFVLKTTAMHGLEIPNSLSMCGGTCVQQ